LSPHLLKSAPCDLEIGFPGLLRFLDESMENVNLVPRTRDVKNAVLIFGMNPNFDRARADGRHRPPITWILALLH
jgi:hypothetical protein